MSYGIQNLAHRTPRRHATPALEQWRREFAAGRRTLATFDDVWRAAIAETYGLASPDRLTAERHFREARRLYRLAQQRRVS